MDEYAELADAAHDALRSVDSIARRGRAPAVTLVVATQRRTQKTMGAGTVRSQLEVRICLRVQERRDVELILDKGMLAAGWNAHTLDAPASSTSTRPASTSRAAPAATAQPNRIADGRHHRNNSGPPPNP